MKKPKLVQLDIGCGPNKKPGHLGIDRITFPGVDHVLDVGKKRLPFKTSTVDAVHMSHFLEHLAVMERCHLLNELHRVLKPKAQAMVIVPMWSSSRAYGDPTHAWPPIGEMFFYYLSKKWRAEQAPHTDAKHWRGGYACDFEATWGYSMHQTIEQKNDEHKQFAVNFYKEAAQDLIATLIAKK